MSHNANLIKMQQQIRNNAQEYSDFVSDLKKWTKDISEKDKKLQEGAQKKKYPPVRGTTSEQSIDPDEEAEKLKETGNEYFKKGDFHKAVEFYSKSLQFKQDAVVYSNRSQAYFKLGNFKESELDATRSISLNSSYVKSYMRRGMARRELKKYKESKDDFEYARKLNPNHTETERELQKAIELLKKSEEGKGTKIAIQEDEEEEVVVPKTSKATSEKPTVSQASVPPPMKQEPVKEQQAKPVEEKKLPKVEEEVIEDLITSGASTNMKDMQKKAPVSQPSQNIETNHKPVDNNNMQQSKPSSQPAVSATTPKSSTASIPETVTIHLKPSIPQAAPKSFFEFEKYYNELKGEDLANYLKAFPPRRFVTILRDSLSPEIFSGIIECLLKYFVRKPFDKDFVLQAFDIMEQISQVNRFDMIIMFLEDKEILMVKSIFNAFYEFSGLEPSKIDSLKEKYIQE